VALSNVQISYGASLSITREPALRIFSSNVRVDDCDLEGGVNRLLTGEGLTAVAAHNSLVVVSNTSLRGGSAAWSGSPGGNGLTLFAGSRAFVVGEAADLVSGGAGLDGGLDGVAVSVCPECALTYGTVTMGAVEDLGGVIEEDLALPYLEISGDLVPGGAVALDGFSVFPDTPAFLFVSTYSGVDPRFRVPFATSDEGVFFVVPGATDGAGLFEVAFGIPDNEIFQGFRFVAQAGFVSQQGTFLANAVDRLIAGF
jgi:hypothetical protein